LRPILLWVKVRMVKVNFKTQMLKFDNYKSEFRVFEIQWHKIMANSIACIAMFLIGGAFGCDYKKRWG